MGNLGGEVVALDAVRVVEKVEGVIDGQAKARSPRVEPQCDQYSRSSSRILPPSSCQTHCTTSVSGRAGKVCADAACEQAVRSMPAATIDLNIEGVLPVF